MLGCAFWKRACEARAGVGGGQDWAEDNAGLRERLQTAKASILFGHELRG